MKKRSLESSCNSESSADESDVDTCSNSDAEEDVTSNNNFTPKSVVKVRPNPAKRVRLSTSSLQISRIKVENKSVVVEPDPIECLDELREYC